MKRLGSRAAFRSLLPALGDAANFYLSLWAALSLRQVAPVAPDLFLRNALSFTPLFVAWAATFYAIGLYELRLVRDFVALVRSLLVSSALSWFLGATYFYLFTPFPGMTPKTHLVLTILIAHGLTLAWRRLWLAFLGFQLLDQNVVFLGDEEVVRQFEDDIRQRAAEMGFSRVGGHSSGADLVVTDPRWLADNWDKAQGALLSAIRQRIPVVSLESFYESLLGKVSPEYAGNPSWVVDFVLPNVSGLYLRIKRAADIAASAILLVVLAPLFGLVSAAIALVDRHPPLYGQRRAGFLGREFVLWKFRTMTVRADAENPFTSAREKDSRITGLGGFLRRYRLDELPQLWNVLKGEMSLVGPRPEWVAEIEVLEKVIPNYHLRHVVQPGITGWAQVYFRATDNPGDSWEKMHYDLYYIKHVSLALDVSILLKTLKRVLVNDASVPSPRARALKPFAAKLWWTGAPSATAARD